MARLIPNSPSIIFSNMPLPIFRSRYPETIFEDSRESLMTIVSAHGRNLGHGDIRLGQLIAGFFHALLLDLVMNGVPHMFLKPYFQRTP